MSNYILWITQCFVKQKKKSVILVVYRNLVIEPASQQKIIASEQLSQTNIFYHFAFFKPIHIFSGQQFGGEVVPRPPGVPFGIPGLMIYTDSYPVIRTIRPPVMSFLFPCCMFLFLCSQLSNTILTSRCFPYMPCFRSCLLMSFMAIQYLLYSRIRGVRRCVASLIPVLTYVVVSGG